MAAPRLAASLAALLASGCSFVLARPPPQPVADPRAPLACTRSRVPGAVDLALGAAALTATLVASAREEPGEPGVAESICRDGKQRGGPALLILPSVAFLISGAHGLHVASVCREATDRQARCAGGDAEACLALTGGAGLEIQEPAARPSGTVRPP